MMENKKKNFIYMLAGKNVALLQLISLNENHKVSLTLGHVHRAWENIWWLVHCSRVTERLCFIYLFEFLLSVNRKLFFLSYSECSCIWSTTGEVMAEEDNP